MKGPPTSKSLNVLLRFIEYIGNMSNQQGFLGRRMPECFRTCNLVEKVRYYIVIRVAFETVLFGNF